MKKPTYFILTLALTFTLTALPAPAQRRQGTGQRNPLAGLERALQAANAVALSSDQQTSITNLISQYKLVQPSSGNTQGLEAAILAGTGTTDSADLAAITGNMTSNFQNRVNFATQVALILKNNSTGDQLTPLVTKFGTSRTVQILESPVGGGFGAGRGFGMAGLRARTR
jgi:hypothetical protein